MTWFDEGINLAVLSLALLLGGLPFMALWIRDTQEPKEQHQSSTNRKSSAYKTIVTTWVLALGIMVAQPASAENFELFVISTGNEVELYQVPSTLKPLKLTGTGIGNPLAIPRFPYLVLDQLGGKNQPFGTERRLISRLQTTPTGRILKIAGRIDWQVDQHQKMMSASPELPIIDESLDNQERLSQLTMSKVAEKTWRGNN